MSDDSSVSTSRYQSEFLGFLEPVFRRFLASEEADAGGFYTVVMKKETAPGDDVELTLNKFSKPFFYRDFSGMLKFVIKGGENGESAFI